MLTFYFSKGSSALAAHILLHEVGADYDAVEVSIAKGEHKTPEFLARNPKGRIPALGTPEGIITENPAILEHIAATHPQAGMQPKDAFARARARSLCAYLCATAHVASAHGRRGSRWASEEASLRDMRAMVPQNMAACAAFVEDDLAFGPWSIGADYSFADPYLFQFTRWLSNAGVEVEDYPKLAAHRRAILDRPATQAVLALHEKPKS